ncbi:pyrroloquinoline quinone precursor peptide PqqA [Lysobacter antibioticus]|uniref:pyrroloquinoline quinone precursor peptide PqqA n=1 Tax=Lysobacter antibioticus TaxID=84531 RepID=UPI0009DF9D53
MPRPPHPGVRDARPCGRAQAIARGSTVPARPHSPTRGTYMKTWSKPQIREISVGCEINSYSSGDLF